MIRALLAFVLAFWSGTAGASDLPYIFTQQHADAAWWWNGTWIPQTIPTGARVQVQLPGDPVVWRPARRCTPTGPAALLPRARVSFHGSRTQDNRDRIDGTSKIFIFDYRVHGAGTAAICLRPAGWDHAQPYKLTLLVGVPQAALSL